MGSVAIDRNVADLIDDQEFGLTVEFQPLFNAVFRIGLGQGGNQGHGLGKVGAIAFGDRFDSESHRQVGLSHSRGAEKDDVFSIGDETARSQLLDPFLVDGRLKGKIKALKRLDKREACHGGPHQDVLFFFGADLLTKESIQKVAVGQTVFGSVFQAGFQLLVNPVELEVLEMFPDSGQLSSAHEAPPCAIRS